MINNGTGLEEYVQQVYHSLLNLKDEGIVVARNVIMTGRAGTPHQIDVFYEFEKAGIRHRVAIECKETGRSVEKCDVMEFHGKITDIGNTIGVMVAKIGYQKGAQNYADHYNLLLLTLQDLPTLNVLLSNFIGKFFFPDDKSVGEPFWTLMEAYADNVSGSYYGGEAQIIPLFFSKTHAEEMHREIPNSQSWAVRGLAQRHLRALIIVVETYGWQVAIFHGGRNRTNPQQWVGIRVTTEELKQDYYLGDIPPINSQ